MADDTSNKIVWTVSINRKLAQRILNKLPKDDMTTGPKKGSRSQLIEGLLKDWADRKDRLEMETKQQLAGVQ